MNLVVDSSVLVAEVLRVRGLQLLNHPDLTLFQPDYAAGETQYELKRRGKLMLQSGRAQPEQVEALLENAQGFLAGRVLQVQAAQYQPYEQDARARIPRDPNDWTLVAVALSLNGAPILTLDGDFLGCGLPTWTPDTLRSFLSI